MEEKNRLTQEQERVKSAVHWLIYKGVVKNQTDIAETLGYTQSALSQLLNGHKGMSVRFLKLLCTLDKSLNIEWLKTGKGEMLLEERNNNNNVQTGTSNVNIQGNGNKSSINATLQAGHWRKIAEQNQEILLKTQEQLLLAQKQISALLSILSAQSKLQDNVAPDIADALKALGQGGDKEIEEL